MVLVIGFIRDVSVANPTPISGDAGWAGQRTQTHPNPHTHTHLLTKAVHVRQCLQLLVPLLRSQQKVVHVGPEGANQVPKELQGRTGVTGGGNLPRLRQQGGGVLLFFLGTSDNTSTWDFLPSSHRTGGLYLLFTVSGAVIYIFSAFVANRGKQRWGHRQP